MVVINGNSVSGQNEQALWFFVAHLFALQSSKPVASTPLGVKDPEARTALPFSANVLRGSLSDVRFVEFRLSFRAYIARESGFAFRFASIMLNFSEVYYKWGCAASQ